MFDINVFAVNVAPQSRFGTQNQIKKKPVNLGFASFDIYRATHVPKKPNLFDCGVFVILFMQSGCKLDSRSFVVSHFFFVLSILVIKYV